MNAATKNAVYIPSNKILTTPMTLASLQARFFTGVEPRTLKLKGSLLASMECYLTSLLMGNNAKMGNDIRNNVAVEVIKAFNNIPFVRPAYDKPKIFQTAIKKGSILVNVTKYCYPIPHVKDVVTTYTVITTTEVLSGQIVHSLGQWDLETDDHVPTEVVGHYLNACRIAAEEQKENAYNTMMNIIFAITPFRT